MSEEIDWEKRVRDVLRSVHPNYEPSGHAVADVLRLVRQAADARAEEIAVSLESRAPAHRDSGYGNYAVVVEMCAKIARSTIAELLPDAPAYVARRALDWRPTP